MPGPQKRPRMTPGERNTWMRGRSYRRELNLELAERHGRLKRLRGGCKSCKRLTTELAALRRDMNALIHDKKKWRP